MKASISTWRSCVSVLAFGLAAALLAAPAGAVPIVLDGNYDGSDVYDVEVPDDVNDLGLSAVFYDPWKPFDITMAGYAWDTDSFYIGLDTVGDFMREGGGGASPEETVFKFEIITDTMLYRLTMDSANAVLEKRLVNNGLTDWVEIPEAQWQVATDTDMEFRIDIAALGGVDVNSLEIKCQLEDNAWMPDDVTDPVVLPEPAALTLLAIGGLVMVIRRKRLA